MNESDSRLLQASEMRLLSQEHFFRSLRLWAGVLACSLIALPIVPLIMRLFPNTSPYADAIQVSMSGLLPMIFMAGMPALISEIRLQHIQSIKYHLEKEATNRAAGSG